MLDAGEAFEVHVLSLERSSSLFTLGSMLLRKPRIFRIGRTGTSSIRLSHAIACTFCPGHNPNCRRSRLGITTWYFGDTSS
jgi:hypothetical protein